MASIKGAITALQNIIREVEGINDASQEPPENLGVYPYAVAYPGGGFMQIGAPAGVVKSVHDIILEVHTGRVDLAYDYEQVTPIFERVAAAILTDPTFNNNGTIADNITFIWGELGWVGSGQTIGWRWTIPFKIQNTDA